MRCIFSQKGLIEPECTITNAYYRNSARCLGDKKSRERCPFWQLVFAIKQLGGKE